MPELPEVETVRRGLAGVFEGRRLTAVKVLRPDLRFPLPTDFSGRLEGRTVATLGRRGKFLLFGLEDGATLIAHLGMSGRFRIFDGLSNATTTLSSRPMAASPSASTIPGGSVSWTSPKKAPFAAIRCWQNWAPNPWPTILTVRYWRLASKAAGRRSRRRSSINR